MCFVSAQPWSFSKDFSKDSIVDSHLFPIRVTAGCWSQSQQSLRGRGVKTWLDGLPGSRRTHAHSFQSHSHTWGKSGICSQWGLNVTEKSTIKSTVNPYYHLFTAIGIHLSRRELWDYHQNTKYQNHTMSPIMIFITLIFYIVGISPAERNVLISLINIKYWSNKKTDWNQIVFHTNCANDNKILSFFVTFECFLSSRRRAGWYALCAHL